MRRISIYGKPSYTYDVLKGRVLETINSARIGVILNEVNSVKKFIDENIDSIPAISVDDEIRTIGKTNLKEFISEVETWILSKHDTSQNVKLVATLDMNESSEAVLSFAANLSRASDLDLELVHACHPIFEEANLNNWDGVVKSKVKELDELIDKIEGKENVGRLIKKNVLQGLAGDVLTEYADKNENALLIFGTKTVKRKFKSFFGSASLSVVKNTKNPFVIVPANPNSKVIKKVAFTVYDVNRDIKSFLKFKEYFNYELDELHFISFDHPIYPIDEIKQFVTEVDPKLKFQFHHIDGIHTIDAVNEFCIAKDIDLLVATKKEKGFFQKLFESSITDQLAEDPKTTLLIIQ